MSKNEMKMRVGLVGMGQMGNAIARLAEARSYEVVATFDSKSPLPESDGFPPSLAPADVVIDFSLPEVAINHIERYCRWQIPGVIGTTGWYDELARVEQWVDQHNASLLYAPNFSLGVALMVRALRGTLALLDDLDEYDVFVHEMHHIRKVDSPSGTALMLADEITQGLGRKSDVSTETQHGQISASTLHVSSTRAGEVFGEHTIGFDSSFDQVRIEHMAKGRDGFALGALRSAEWLLGRHGLYTLDDVLRDLES